MIVFEDEELLTTWLGEVPDDVRQECDLWTRWYHSAGAGGALGPLSLITILRQLGYAPPKTAERATEVDWRQVPVRTRVEAQFGGKWLPGEYLGFVESGTLAVRLDGDDFVHECRKTTVRLATDTMSVTPKKATQLVDDEPDEPLDVEFSVVADTGEFPVVQGYPKNPTHETSAYTAPENPGGEVVAGDKVLVADGDDVLNGVCVSVGDWVTVLIDGEEQPREFAPPSVTTL